MSESDSAEISYSSYIRPNRGGKYYSSTQQPLQATPYQPLSTSVVYPTYIPLPTVPPTSTPLGSPGWIGPGGGCKLWNYLSSSDLGNEICVYGKVVKFYATEEYGQIIRFSEEPGTFMVRGRNYVFDDIERGKCIAVRGIIQSANNQYLYVDIDDQQTTFSKLEVCSN